MSLLPPPEKPKIEKGASSPSSSSGSGLTPPKPPAPPTAVAKAEAMASGMLSSLRVSLMPSDLEGRPAPNISKGLVILAVVLLVETAIIGGLYFFAGRSVNDSIAQRTKLKDDIARIDKETAALEAAAIPAVSYAYQLQAAKETLSKHVYWSSFFAFLEKNTLPSVKYLTFAGNSSTGIVTLDCFAGTYLDVAQQIVSLREVPMILDVRSNSASARVNELGEITGISFSLVIKIKPEVWSLTTAPSAMQQDQGSASPASATIPAQPSSGSETGGQKAIFQAVPSETTPATTTPDNNAAQPTVSPDSPGAPSVPTPGAGTEAFPAAPPYTPPPTQ